MKMVALAGLDDLMTGGAKAKPPPVFVLLDLNGAVDPLSACPKAGAGNIVVAQEKLPYHAVGAGREEGTAPAEWIQGLPSNRLNAFGMSSTWNVMLNEHEPTSMRRSISPFTSLREPSKARTAVLLGRTQLRSTFICLRV
ncbi:hypothetical protein CRG98_036316, partial [Punica granatum]